MFSRSLLLKTTLKVLRDENIKRLFLKGCFTHLLRKRFKKFNSLSKQVFFKTKVSNLADLFVRQHESLLQKLGHLHRDVNLLSGATELVPRVHQVPVGRLDLVGQVVLRRVHAFRESLSAINSRLKTLARIWIYFKSL